MNLYRSANCREGRGPAFAARGILCMILALGLIGAAHAEETAAPAPERSAESFLIASIAYTGFYKTSKARLAAVSGLREGATATYAEIELAERKLYDTGLYSSVKISVQGDGRGKEVVVDLTEKWTFIPIPIFSTSGDGIVLGLLAFDSDFLGSGNAAHAGAIGGLSQVTGIVGFSIQDPRALDFSIDVNAMGGYRKVTETDSSGSAYAKYGLRSGDISANLNFLKRSDFHFSALSEFAWADPSGDAGLDMDDDYLVALPGIRLGYQSLTNRGWFKEGISATASYKVGLSLRGAGAYQAVEAHGSYSTAILGPGYFALGGSALLGDEPEPLRFQLRGNGFRTLPSDTSFSSQAASAYCQYEAPLFDFGWATLTACSFYEYGYYRMGADSDAPWRQFTGPGIGQRFYLRDIALPAVGVDCAYNLLDKKFIIAGTIGFSM